MENQTRASRGLPAVKTDCTKPPLIESGAEITERYADYLTDESRLQGTTPREIAFPSSAEEVAAYLADAEERSLPVTLSGGRTGIVGGAVALEGAVLSLDRLDQILGLRRVQGEWRVRLQPGVSLERLERSLSSADFGNTDSWSNADKEALRKFRQEPNRYFYPVDPTEMSAHLGGTVATNASGARSFGYGPTRRYVRGLKVALPGGFIVSLERGQYRFSGRTLYLEFPGETRTVQLPTYETRSRKSTAGYYIRPDMDPIDLFIGAEGTLGAITEIELALVERPEVFFSALAFFPSEEDAISFVNVARSHRAGLVQPVTLEFFDEASLQLAASWKEKTRSVDFPPYPPGARAAVFFEQLTTEEDIEDIFMAWDELLAECGSSMDNTWEGLEEESLRRLRDLRHAVPEAVNNLVSQYKLQHPELHKLSTDMAVPDEHLGDLIAMYRSALNSAGLEYVIFGHIGDNHLHVNVIPRTPAEMEKTREIYHSCAQEVLAMGGTVAAEHGIGKLKRELLLMQYGEEGVSEMLQVKKAFDPKLILNRGNLFPVSMLHSGAK